MSLHGHRVLTFVLVPVHLVMGLRGLCFGPITQVFSQPPNFPCLTSPHLICVAASSLSGLDVAVVQVDPWT